MRRKASNARTALSPDRANKTIRVSSRVAALSKDSAGILPGGDEVS